MLSLGIHSHIPLLSTDFPPLIVQIVICGLAFAQGKSGTLKAIALLEKPIPSINLLYKRVIYLFIVLIFVEYNGLGTSSLKDQISYNRISKNDFHKLIPIMFI